MGRSPYPRLSKPNPGTSSMHQPGRLIYSDERKERKEVFEVAVETVATERPKIHAP